MTDSSEQKSRRQIYVTGHKNPDMDSIGSAMGYAELKQKLDPESDYIPVRLGDTPAQAEWVLEKAGAEAPELLEHIRVRVQDVMKHDFPVAVDTDPVREVGLMMARDELDLVPVVRADGTLMGVVTERALARRYIRESRDRETSTLVDTPTTVGAIVGVTGGELLCGEDKEIEGRVWVHSIDPAKSASNISPGDVVVVGNRTDAQLQAIELGISLLVSSGGETPDENVLAAAREKGCTVVVSPLDSYVTSRMITLAAPCRTLANDDPLTVDPDDLLSDVAEEVKDVHYRAAIAVDDQNKPVGLVTRNCLVSPTKRCVILVDHAEAAQSVDGIEEAEICEILDHHHIGSIETSTPVKATFDPVGCTATLVYEGFEAAGLEPSRETATVLLGALLSDSVILNSPTTTDRDERVVKKLAETLGVDFEEFGRGMFEASSDVSGLTADKIVTRDSKPYQLPGGEMISIAQIETVGSGLLDRKMELLEALDAEREANHFAVAALMVTDILAQGTDLLITGDPRPVERAFEKSATDSVIELPGVMSRKKQVAPKLLAM